MWARDFQVVRHSNLIYKKTNKQIAILRLSYPGIKSDRETHIAAKENETVIPLKFKVKTDGFRRTICHPFTALETLSSS